jgi:hypothetical protein
MAVVYKHIRLDTNEVFYVGIGKSEKRAYDKRRSSIWKSITNKTKYDIQILRKDLSWGDACELEKILISHYGRRDLCLGTLVNMTDGGDGTIGFTPTDEMNKKRSEKLKGRIFTQEHKDKISKALKGHKVSEKSLMALKERNKQPISETQRENMSKAQKKRYNKNETN